MSCARDNMSCARQNFSKKNKNIGVKDPVLNWKKIVSDNYAWSEDREGGWLLTAFFQAR